MLTRCPTDIISSTDACAPHAPHLCIGCSLFSHSFHLATATADVCLFCLVLFVRLFLSPFLSSFWQLSGGYHFGKRPFRVSEEHQKWNFTAAGDGAPAWQVEQAGSGASGVKFGAGFRRRMDIGQDRARKDFEAHKAQRKEQVAQSRRSHLASCGSRLAFNPVTGAPIPGRAPPAPERPAVKHHGDVKSDYLKREGDVLLRVSDSRFHVPVSRAPDDPRTRRIATDGLVTTTRASSVLGHGRADMRSYGVKDNFEYSLYDPAYRTQSPRDAPGPPLGTTRTAAASVPGLDLTRSSSGAASVRASSPAASTVHAKPHAPELGHAARARPDIRTGPSGAPSVRSSASMASRTSQLRSHRASQRKQEEVQSVRELR